MAKPGLSDCIGESAAAVQKQGWVRTEAKRHRQSQRQRGSGASYTQALGCTPGLAVPVCGAVGDICTHLQHRDEAAGGLVPYLGESQRWGATQRLQHLCKCTCQTLLQACVHTNPPANTHSVCAQMNLYTHTHTNTCTHARTRARTDTHTHTHTHREREREREVGVEGGGERETVRERERGREGGNEAGFIKERMSCLLVFKIGK